MSASTPEATAQQRAVELLRSAQRFLLTGHVRPDGDCVGAQAALSRVLEALGKDVWIVNPDPLQAQFDYLVARSRTTASWSPGDALPAARRRPCLLDCSGTVALRRHGAGPMERDRLASKLVIDHHVHVGEEWWDEAYVDVSASATGLLVLPHRVARSASSSTPTAAEGVFTSMVTDTGWFKYSNTDAETLRVRPANSSRTAAWTPALSSTRSIYQRSEPRPAPARDRRACCREHEVLLGRQASPSIHLPLPRPGEPELADGDDALDILRAVGTVEVVLFVREQRSGHLSSSRRARKSDDYDVSAARAGASAGGGHRRSRPARRSPGRSVRR